MAPKDRFNLLRFGSCKKGDLIEIQFLKPLKSLWVIENGQSDTQVYFIDEGKTLPYGLAEWKHQHIIQKTGKKTCEIIDNIEYKGKNKLINFIPFFYLLIKVR